MALDRSKLEFDLQELFGSEHSKEQAVKLLANAIENYVKSADVNALPNEVNVTGSQGQSANLAPLKFTGGLS